MQIQQIRLSSDIVHAGTLAIPTPLPVGITATQTRTLPPDAAASVALTPLSDGAGIAAGVATALGFAALTVLMLFSSTAFA